MHFNNSDGKYSSKQPSLTKLSSQAHTTSLLMTDTKHPRSTKPSVPFPLSLLHLQLHACSLPFTSAAHLVLARLCLQSIAFSNLSPRSPGEMLGQSVAWTWTFWSSHWAHCLTAPHTPSQGSLIHVGRLPVAQNIHTPLIARLHCRDSFNTSFSHCR